MSMSIEINEKERLILLDLLRVEQKELPTEIHHSEHGQYRDELHRRKTMVNDLVERLEFLEAPVRTTN